jgi:hypothetical protein
LNPHKTTNAVNFEVPLRNILFVTDFSPSSELALPYAVALASRYNGKLYVAHVIAPEMYEFVPQPLFLRYAGRLQATRGSAWNSCSTLQSFKASRTMSSCSMEKSGTLSGKSRIGTRST